MSGYFLSGIMADGSRKKTISALLQNTLLKICMLPLFTVLLSGFLLTLTAASPLFADSNGIKPAIVVLNTESLTDREYAVSGLFMQFGLEPSIISLSDADFAGLESFDIITATEEAALSASVINELIQNSKLVWLFYNAGKPLGGSWNSGNAATWWNLNIEANEIFFDGYSSSLTFRVQHLGHAFYIESAYPAGWTSIGTNQNAGQKTILYREHSSGGKALIFTYDPNRTLAIYRNIYDLGFEWLTGGPPHSGKTVPENQVAFVISRYNDDNASPDLSDAENALHNKLLGYGFDVTFIRPGRLKHSDLTRAAMVVAGDYPSLDRHTVNDLLSSGNRVLLSGPSGASLGGEWNSGNTYSWWDLNIEENEIFFDGYSSNLTFNVQHLGNAFYIGSAYPAGWISIGTNRNAAQKTILYREHTSGGKALIFTYDPSRTLEICKNIYDLIYEWMTGEPAYSGKTVPENQVAFVISRYNDSGTPDLSSSENALYSRLLDYGFEITFIRSSRLKHSDLTGAVMIAAGEYPSIDRHTVNYLLNNAKPVLLTGSAGASLGGEWSSGNTYSWWDLNIESSDKFFETYSSESLYGVQNGGYAYYIGSNYPGGWSSIGSNRASGQKTAFYREHFSGGRGAVFTYSPDNITGQGGLILESIKNWLVPLTPCPPGIPEYNTSRGILRVRPVCIDGVYYKGEREFIILDFEGEESISLAHIIYLLQIFTRQNEIPDQP